MKQSVIAYSIAALVAMGAGSLAAQEMGAAPAAKPAATKAPVAPVAAVPAPKTAPLALSTPSDQGPQIVRENQKHAPAVTTPKGDDAESVVTRTLAARGFDQVYDPARGSIIQVGTAVDNVDDPTSPDFMIKRELLVRQAELAARIRIASVVRQQMNGSTRVNTPGTDERKTFEKRFEAQIAAIDQQQAKVQELLGQLEASEGSMLAGVTVQDQWKKLMDGVIKRLDAKYNQNDIAVEKQQQYLKIKAAYEQARKQLDELERAKDEMFPRKTVTSEAEAYAEMRLCGTVSLVQSESWNGKLFQVAVAVVWSPKLQERALITLGCGVPPGGRPGSNGSLGAWLQKQADAGELGKLVGTRQFIDDKGRQYVLGFSAAEIPSDATDYEDAMEQTDLFARQAVAFYLFSEGNGSSKVKASMQKFKGRASEAAARVRGEMMAALPKDFTVSGLGKVFSAKCRNELSGKNIYVCVAAVDSALAGKSSEILKSWYEAGIRVVSTSQYLAGEQQGMNDAYQQVKNSDAAFEQGRSAGQTAIVNAFQPPAQATAPSAPAPVVPAAATPSNGKPQQGVYITNPQAISDDF